MGKVEVFKSVEHEWKDLESTSDYSLKHFNKRKHFVQIWQGESLAYLQTDTTGIFKAVIDTSADFIIKVYPQSPIFSAEFKFDAGVYKDTLDLRISDERLAVYRDSLREPEFHKKYSMKQAELDFNNGKYQLLAYLTDWPRPEYTKNIRRIENEYNVTFEYFADHPRERIRIMYRYNQVMKKLLGIEGEVWR